MTPPMTLNAGRRTFLGSIASLLPAALVSSARSETRRLDGPADVPTTGGPVRGAWVRGVATFKGIPYGAPVSGAGRFRPATAPGPWRAPFAALDYGPACPQSDPSNPHRRVQEREDEDCLTLNVWTPALNDGRKRPVMVWLHGGGLWRLSAAGESQAGYGLAASGDVVMVSPNHRIGVFGFLHLADMDPAFAGSSHLGMLDLVLALQWVRDNIAEFGGDPDNVTIMGQSGGGQKVSLLMAMPAARGLFHKAIIQSGPMPLSLKADHANDLAARLIGHCGLQKGDAKALQALPVEALLNGYYRLFREIGGFGVLGIVQDVAPVVDGVTLPQQPFWNGASDLVANIPLMIGSTGTEMTEYMLDIDPNLGGVTHAGIADSIRFLFGGDADRIAADYIAHHPGLSGWETLSLIRSDWPTRLFSLRIADAKAAQPAPVHMYRMDWRTTERHGLLMSPHAIDIPFALNTVGAPDLQTGQLGEQHRMAEQMSRAWIAFARTGNPWHRGLPRWPRYDASRRATMLFNLTSHIADDPDGADIRTLERNIGHYRLVAGGMA